MKCVFMGRFLIGLSGHSMGDARIDREAGEWCERAGHRGSPLVRMLSPWSALIRMKTLHADQSESLWQATLSGFNKMRYIKCNFTKNKDDEKIYLYI